MEHDELVTKIVEKGIAAARRDYHRPDQQLKLEGSVKGFQDCLGRDIAGLRDLLNAAIAATIQMRGKPEYWWHRCYELEVHWVCNVVSVGLHEQKLPLIVMPTARAMMTYASIVGVQDHSLAD